MQIEVWSDYQCPMCYIGRRRLEHALDKFEHRDKVEIVYRSFELMPHAKQKTGKSIHEMVAAKKNWSLDQAISIHRQLEKMVEQDGLKYVFDTMVPTNSFDSLRLTHYADEHGKQPEFAERIFKAFFTDSLDIGDHATLAKLAGEVGLDEAEIAEVLSSSRYTDAVKNDHKVALSMGVQGVPFYIVNEKYAISGAQSPEVFLDTLRRAWGEQLVNVSNSEPDGVCIDGECVIRN